jgi:hypothetical protein
VVVRRGQRGGVVRHMERAAVNGLELEYEVRGSGEPVVLIHWGVGATCPQHVFSLRQSRGLWERFRVGWKKCLRFQWGDLVADQCLLCVCGPKWIPPRRLRR